MTQTNAAPPAQEGSHRQPPRGLIWQQKKCTLEPVRACLSGATMSLIIECASRSRRTCWHNAFSVEVLQGASQTAATGNVEDVLSSAPPAAPPSGFTVHLRVHSVGRRTVIKTYTHRSRGACRPGIRTRGCNSKGVCGPSGLSSCWLLSNTKLYLNHRMVIWPPLCNLGVVQHSQLTCCVPFNYFTDVGKV